MISKKRPNFRKIGTLGENIAEKHLQRGGFQVFWKNWTGRAAEIDLIAHDPEGVLWFFEVKFRRGQSSGTATEAFTAKKRHDFFRAVSLYCVKNAQDIHRVRAGLIAIDRTEKWYRITRYGNLSP